MPTASSRLQLSEIAPSVIQSEIRAMSVLCDAVGGINLAQGICDTDLPNVVAEGAIDAIHNGHNIYTRLDGVAPLREAIADKLQRYNRLTVDPQTQILVTNGVCRHRRGGFGQSHSGWLRRLEKQLRHPDRAAAPGRFAGMRSIR